MWLQASDLLCNQSSSVISDFISARSEADKAEV